MKKTLIILIMVVSLLSGCSCDKKEENKNSRILDENSNVEIQDVKVNELDVIDFVVLYENSISEVYFTVENNTESDVNYEKIECSLYDKNDKLIYSFDKDLGLIEAMDQLDIVYKVDLDLTKVAKVQYDVK